MIDSVARCSYRVLYSVLALSFITSIFFQITGDPCDLIGSYRCDLFSLVANLTTNFYDLAAKDGEIGDH